MNWYLAVLKQYAVFSGRARRKEYWYFLLFSIIASIILSIIDGLLMATIGIAGLYVIYSLGIIIPSLAVSVRRLHDTGRSGWWLFINLIPLIGAIVFLVFMVQDSQADENQYGANVKGDFEVL